MLDCPRCSKEVNKLTIPLGGKLGCTDCNQMAPRPYNANLHQTVDFSTHVNKEGKEIKHRITTGKAWEIENRRISPDDRRIVINAKTGKEAQY